MAEELITTYTAGDSEPILRRTSEAVEIDDLTGYTIRLRIRRPDGIDLVKTITEVDDPLEGHIDDPTAEPPAFFFQFVESDLVAGGLQRAEIEFDDGAGGISTERDVFFNVGGQIG